MTTSRTDLATSIRPPAAARTVRVRVPERRHDPARVVVHLGPTNSGKTHGSISELAAAGAGIYVAPLRMLAQEVFDQLVRTCAADKVGLVTGDQVIRPDAPILCCTAETAPLEAPLAVIDEAHWVDDLERGKSWTRLLVEGRYERLALIAAPETEGFLRQLHPHLEVVRHQRLGELWWGGGVPLEQVWPGSVVVAFSRKAVLALARELTLRAGLRAGVLYGALPAATRVDQVERFEAGELDVLVATDSIGHGVNLPASTIVFAETEKYDGWMRRPLRLWEAAQIAGRAGRGADRPGLVQSLVGSAGFHADAALVEHAVTVASGGSPSDLTVTRAPVCPAFADLGIDDPAQLRTGLETWQQAAWDVLADHPWARPADTSSIDHRLRATLKAWKGARPLDAAGTWHLATTPIADDRALVLAAQALVDPTFDLLATLGASRAPDLADMEARAATLRDLLVLVRRFGPLGDAVPEELERLRSDVELEVAGALDEAILTNGYGRCRSCGQAAGVRFPTCARCTGLRSKDRSSRRRTDRRG